MFRFHNLSFRYEKIWTFNEEYEPSFLQDEHVNISKKLWKISENYKTIPKICKNNCDIVGKLFISQKKIVNVWKKSKNKIINNITCKNFRKCVKISQNL